MPAGDSGGHLLYCCGALEVGTGFDLLSYACHESQDQQMLQTCVPLCCSRCVHEHARAIEYGPCRALELQACSCCW